MFVWSFRMNKRELIIAAAGLLIFAVMAALLLARGGAFGRKEPETGGSDVSEASIRAASIRAASIRVSGAEQCAAYLASLGWETEDTPISVREVVIPLEFDDEFADYSEMQLGQGFNMEALRGKRVKLYTYRITNYPADDGSIVANLLVKDGHIAGGDISQARAGGAVQGLDPVKYGSAAAKLQRELSEAVIDRSVPDAIPVDSDALPEPDSEGEW